MDGHKLYGLPTPTQDSDAATKKWVTDDFPTKSDILDGFTMKGPFGYEWTQDLRGAYSDQRQGRCQQKVC